MSGQEPRGETGGPTLVPRIPDYDLLRLVGRGSYGEVWMARNVVGALRAVKVVWRRSFTSDKPYEREFEGIRKYEAVSRTHESLIDVLHVGRDEKEGLFYYAMELADDACVSEPGAAVTPAEYRPKTLSDVLLSRGRLPVAQCLEIGVRLAAGLTRLHEAGLVHRDIKPSNIIFVGKQPKLADIGMVAGIAQAKSFVGTEGFVPPEGQGTPGADVFSLGKVLYEMATGLDRNDFPKLPTVGGESGLDPAEFAEFNEVLLRACDPSAAMRYQSARELHGDLVLLQGGRSLRRLRGLERRVAIFSRVGLVAALLALVALAAYFGSFKQIQRAERAERLALANVELLEMQKAEDLFRRDDSSSALAYLAHVVRSNPTNRIAAERLVSALTWRDFVLSYAAMVPASRPRVATFTPDEQSIISGGFNGEMEFWNAQSGVLELRIQTTEDQAMFALEFSPDGKSFVVGTFRQAQVYDLQSRKLVVSGFEHGSRVSSATFSPDQNWILTSSYDNTARIWDARTARPTDIVFEHAQRLRRAIYSPDGKKVVTASLDATARIWDPLTGNPLSPPLEHKARVNQIAFSPDGSLLATASDDGTACLWETATGALLRRLTHRAGVTEVRFSPDGSKLVTASEDRTAVLWDVASGERIGEPMRHRAWVRDADFSPDGLRLVTASEDNTTRFWDASTAQPVSEPMRHPQALAHVQFSRSGARLLTAVSSVTDSGIWLWNAFAGTARSLPFKNVMNARDAHFAHGGQQLGVVGQDNALRVWNPWSTEREPRFLQLDRPIEFFAFSRDGRSAATVSGSSATVWDLTTMKAIGGPFDNQGEIRTLDFSPDGRLLITAGERGKLFIWNTTATGPDEPVRSIPIVGDPARSLPRTNVVFSARFSPDGSRVLAACRFGMAALWEVESGVLLFEFPHEHWVVSAEFSSDGQRIVTASIDRTARVWDSQDGSPVGVPMSHDNDLTTARFSPNGRRVVTASTDSTARVWDAETGLPVSESMRHDGPIRTVCFSPDGVRIATGGEDQTARVWDAETGWALTNPFRESGTVANVEFSPDGAFLLIVPENGDVRIVEVPRPVLPAPSWLPDLAEAVGGLLLNTRQMVQSVPIERFFELKKSLLRLEPSDSNRRWVQWFLSDYRSRSISPNSNMSLDEYVERRVASDSLVALREAICLSPTNGLAHARLARHLAHQAASENPRQAVEADWHSRYATSLAPDNEEVRRIRSDINTQGVSAVKNAVTALGK